MATTMVGGGGVGGGGGLTSGGGGCARCVREDDGTLGARGAAGGAYVICNFQLRSYVTKQIFGAVGWVSYTQELVALA